MQHVSVPVPSIFPPISISGVTLFIMGDHAPLIYVRL